MIQEIRTWMIEGGTSSSQGWLNPLQEIYEKMYHECIDQSWIIGNKSDHKQHVDWMDLGDVCLCEREGNRLPIMKGGISNILP